MPTLTLVLTVAGYLASALAFYLPLVRTPSSAQPLGVARRLLVATAVVHAGDVVVRSTSTHSCPVLSAVFALSLAALITTISFLAWAGRSRLLVLGVIVTPISLAMFIASAALSIPPTVSDVSEWFLALHVFANLSAVALFVVAAAAAMAYLFQSGRLKSKRPAAGGAAFPGLSSLETLIQRLLTLGLGLMTLGVISGAVFAERLSPSGVVAIRVVLSYVCWLIVAGMVVGQRFIGHSGRRVAWGAVMVATMAVTVVVLYARSRGGHA
jgi:ABC-type uncharacterized transport system permease subunit